MYDHQDDNRKFWFAAIWTTFWLSWIIILFVIATSDAAQAGHGNNYVPQPPAQYDRLPDNYVIRKVKLETLRIVCLEMKAVGCSIASTDGRACIILMPTDGEPHLYQQTLTHEFGHCNGWPASHPKSFKEQGWKLFRKRETLKEGLIR